MTRRKLRWVLVAFVVLFIELGVTIGTVTGDPFAPVDGWGPTRSVDALTFVMVVLGCAALALFARFPLAVAMIATASYVVFAVRDYEPGMFLPPMVVIFALTALTRHRPVAVCCTLASLAAALVWVGHRIATITDSGVALLAGVAFGAVFAVFFIAPLLVGEIVRARSQLRKALAPADGARA